MKGARNDDCCKQEGSVNKPSLTCASVSTINISFPLRVSLGTIYSILGSVSLTSNTWSFCYSFKRQTPVTNSWKDKQKKFELVLGQEFGS